MTSKSKKKKSFLKFAVLLTCFILLLFAGFILFSGFKQNNTAIDESLEIITAGDAIEEDEPSAAVPADAGEQALPVIVPADVTEQENAADETNEGRQDAPDMTDTGTENYNSSSPDAVHWPVSYTPLMQNVSDQTARSSGTSISITKNPRSECLAIGGKVWFIANADGAASLVWQMVDPYGNVHSLDEAGQLLNGITLEDLGDGTIAVSSVPAAANGWGVEARFINGSDYAITEPAYLYVGDYLTSYGPVLDDYRTLINYGDTGSLRYDIWTDLDYKNAGLGYKLKDLDGDSSPEMIIAAMNDVSGSPGWDDIIYSVFTLKNGIPEELFHSWARNRFYYSSLGFYNSGSGGAMWSDNYIYRFSNGSFSVAEGVCTQDDQANPCFMVVGGNRDCGARSYISLQEYKNRIAYYESTIINLGVLTKIN